MIDAILMVAPALCVFGLILVVRDLRRRIETYERKLTLVHWEACKLASFFEDMGIEFNWRSIDELTPEHFEAFARERPKYLCGIAHTIDVEMHAVSEMRAGVSE